MLNDAARLAGRVARGAGAGALDILDLAGMPAKLAQEGIANLIGSERRLEAIRSEKPTAELFTNAVDAATNNALQAQNEGERYTENAARFVGGGLLPAAGLAGMGIKGATSGAGKVLQFLAPRTATDVVGAATAGLANQYAQENDLGTAGTVLATLAGGAAPALTRAAAPIAARNINAAAKAIDPGGIVGSTAKIAQNSIISRTADDIFSDVIGRSKLSPEELKTQLSAGKISNLADIAGDEVQGLTRAMGKVEGARNIIADALEGRSQTAVKRVVGQLSKSISNVDTYFGNLDDIAKARSTIAAPLYDEAYKANPTIQSKVIDKILETPDGRDAMAFASRSMQNKMAAMGVKDPELMAQARALGMSVEDGVSRGLNLQSLDQVKRGFDEAIGVAKRAGSTERLRDLTKLKNTLLNELDSADTSGSYAKARSVFSGFSRLADAQEAGLTFKNLSPEEITKQLKSLDKGEREAYRIGVRQRLQKEVLTTADGADPAKRIFGNTYEREQLQAVLGKGKQYKDFAARLNEEIRAANTKFKVLGGSRTDINLAGDEALAQTIKDFKNRGLQGTLLDKGIDFVANKITSRYYGINKQNAEAVARALIDRKAGMDALQKLIAKQGKTEQGDAVKAVVDDLSVFSSRLANPNVPEGSSAPATGTSKGAKLLSSPVAAIGALGAARLATEGQQDMTGGTMDAQPMQPVDSGVTAPMPAPVTPPPGVQYIIDEEGYKPRVYYDTRNNKTIGYGFNLDQPNAAAIIKRVKIPESFEALKNGQPISEASAAKLFDYTFNASEKAARRIVPSFDQLGENQQAALTSMVYQMGGDGLKGFKKTLRYLAEGNAKAVENQILNSLMAEQTPARAKRTALMLAYNLSPQQSESKLLQSGRISAKERKYMNTLMEKQYASNG
jgi:GH24 family phage-related lysozyme (muramidase)